MKSVFECCEPRKEVLEGELREDIFAARLHDVVEGKADPVYQNAQVFFSNTYRTEGLKSLLKEVLGRVTGRSKASNPVIRLETAFGGGKTHSLIALYHVCRGNLPIDVAAELAGQQITLVSAIRVAAIAADSIDPVSGLKHGKVVVHSLLGELAYQLRGEEGYALAKEADLAGGGGSSALLEEILGDEPTVIMIDEIAGHMRKARAKQVGSTTVADLVPSFLASLLDVASSRSNVVVVYTLAGLADAYSKETEQISSAITDAIRVSARKEHVITPTGETEVAAVVNHRLFQRIDSDCAQEVADAFGDLYTEFIDRDAPLPVRAEQAEYRDEIARTYPFHPEFLDTLTRKIATIPNFQRTRGALRLLARVVRRLWELKPTDAHLIHIHHVDFGLEQIAEELTSRLDKPLFRPAIEADIVSAKEGHPAHASLVDEEYVDADKPPYASRVAATVFLHSLTAGKAGGVDLPSIMLSVVGPGDEPVLIEQAAEKLYDECWFLHYDGHDYRFGTEFNLPKVVADEAQAVSQSLAKEHLDSVIRKVWGRSGLKPVYFKSEPSEVEDSASEPQLVILHYDTATMKEESTDPPSMAMAISQVTGSAEAPRSFRNHVLFLVADEGQKERMIELSRKLIALDRITSSAERMAAFTKEQQDKLKGMKTEEYLYLRVAITKAYSHLFYPSADAPKGKANLEHLALPPQDKGSADKDQTPVLLNLLRSLKKILSSDADIAPAYARQKAWPPNQAVIPTVELRRSFARRMSLPIMLDPNPLKACVRNGVLNGTWIYVDAANPEWGYGTDSPAPAVTFSEDALLYLPEEAKRVGLKIKGVDDKEKKDVCPKCGKRPCVCGKRLAGEVRFQGQGEPQRAFQQVLDQAGDAKANRINALSLSIGGTGKQTASDLKASSLAMGQVSKAEIRVVQKITADLNGDTVEINYEGGWDNFKSVRQLTENLGMKAAEFHGTFEVTLEFPDGTPVTGDIMERLRDALTSMQVSSLTVTAVAVPEEPKKRAKPAKRRSKSK